MVVSKIFFFHPYLGKWSYLTNIFQMGWNHQLDSPQESLGSGEIQLLAIFQTVDGNPANQLRLVVFFPIIYKVLYIQPVVGLGISEPSTGVLGELPQSVSSFCNYCELKSTKDRVVGPHPKWGLGSDHHFSHRIHVMDYGIFTYMYHKH